MTGIGNDIIDLNCINAERTKQKKFYSKFINDSEVKLYDLTVANVLSFEVFVWLCWSIKESVYKYCQRNNTQLAFAPGKIILKETQLQVELDLYCITIKAFFQGDNFYAESFICDNVIHTIVFDQHQKSKIIHKTKRINSADASYQSKTLKEFAHKSLQTVFNDASLSITKHSAGYPVITAYENVPLSFSHHGNYIGFALLKNH